MASAASVLILVVTVYELRWATPTLPANGAIEMATQGGNGSALGDSPLAFNVSSRWPSIIAFATIGLGVVMLLLLFILYGLANSVQDLYGGEVIAP